MVGARDFLHGAPWLVNLPGLVILLTVLGFNLLGNALRDVLDPRLSKM
jgi:peptide/nickel transport system permease protein